MEAFLKFGQWRVGAEPKVLGLPTTDAEPSDLELLRQLGQGNEAAFRMLYDRYQGPIYRFALHMAGDSATANEATQEVFMSLIRNSKGYDPARGSVAGYMFGIARNLVRRDLEQRRLEVPLPEEAGDGDHILLAADLSVLEELSAAETLDLLRKAVLALPELYREAIVLCDLEEMTYAAAGEALGCSPGTVASRLHRARSLLKTKLKAQPCVKSCVK
jgi:RNA polymerase sigma-70 factor (ECF subfamily)